MISALISDGPTRAILRTTTVGWAAPAFLLEELERHVETIRRKAHDPPPNLAELATELIGLVNILDEDALMVWRRPAETVLNAADPDDVAYLACALAVQAVGIWSHDRHFDRQTLVPRVTNADLLQYLP